MSISALPPRRPRVCLVAPEFIGPFPNGGVGTACYWEALTLTQAGFDVTVLYTGPTDRETPAHWERTYRSSGFTYVDLSAWASATGEAAIVERRQHACAEARTSELVYRFLRGRAVDLLLFQEFLGHGARTLQARRAGEALAAVPAAVTLHSCRQWIYQGMQRTQASADDLAVDFLERESARLADLVIAPSRHMAAWAAEHWPAVAPARVVPYCYDRTVEPPPARVEHAGPFEHLVFFGRLETRKGLHLLCRALARSAEARGPVRRVTFLGKRSTVEGQPTEVFIRQALAGLPDLAIDIVDTLNSFEALAWLGRQPRALVVAPSLVDNLPYAVIELFARRIPFVSTRIGGIPDIVGEANRHLLAEPTVPGLAALLARVHGDGGLVTDYRDGYSSAGATDAHLDCVRSMLRWRPAPLAPETEAGDVVVVDVAGDELDRARSAFIDADPTARVSRFLTWDDWRATPDRGRPAVFVSAGVTPRPGLVRRLLDTLRDARVRAATSDYAIADRAGAVDVAPLGASLEAGWAGNVFGGPCVAAAPEACATLRETGDATFHFWPACVALASAGHDIAVVPSVLYSTDRVAANDGPEAVEAVLRRYRRPGARSIDLGWVLKHARSIGAGARSGHTGHGGRGLYDHLLAIPEQQLAVYCGLAAEGPDRMTADLRRLRARLGEIARRWDQTAPRVLVYGAGEHTRLMLALEPALGRHIAGFIDRRPIARFLSRPCIRPEAVSPTAVDAILYSSREFERDMQARLAALPVEHVLLYAPSPAAAEPTTAERLRRRFGHGAVAIDALRGMYRPPAWTTGVISGGDAEFLLELVSGVQPHTVLELGVASGASSAALLLALDHLPASARPRRLHSCDVRASCYFDDRRPTGSAVAEMYPAHRATWTLDAGADARQLSRALPSGWADLLFIDANHSHPWPLLDLLHLAVVAAPGAWVALHDIELPTVAPQYQAHGPQWLFEAWPFNKVHGVGASRNIGAVQLPGDLSDLMPMALALLDRPWEHTPTTRDVDLPAVFAEVSAALSERLAPVVVSRAV